VRLPHFRSAVPRDFDAVFRCARPTIDGHSRLFDASTLLDGTMGPFSLRSVVYSESSSSFRAPEPQKCLHLPEVVCVAGESFWGCSKCQLGMRPSIARYTTATAIGTRTGTPGHFISVYPESCGSFEEKKKEREEEKKKKEKGERNRSDRGRTRSVRRKVAREPIRNSKYAIRFPRRLARRCLLCTSTLRRRPKVIRSMSRTHAGSLACTLRGRCARVERN
jgi:hypothetical protein